MNSEQRAEYRRLLDELDELRQQDNHILFALGNPVELDEEKRGEILAHMRAKIGAIQRLEFLMWVSGNLKPDGGSEPPLPPPDEPFTPDF